MLFVYVYVMHVDYEILNVNTFFILFFVFFSQIVFKIFLQVFRLILLIELNENELTAAIKKTHDIYYFRLSLIF